MYPKGSLLKLYIPVCLIHSDVSQCVSSEVMYPKCVSFKAMYPKDFQSLIYSMCFIQNDISQCLSFKAMYSKVSSKVIFPNDFQSDIVIQMYFK